MGRSSGGLRATRIGGGGGSCEPDRHRELADRVTVDYHCPAGTTGHRLPVVLSHDAEPPPAWTCRHHGIKATLPAGTPPADMVTDERVARTPWVMLRERRTLDELDALLHERLAHLRARRDLG
ncbi:RNA polymerase-binding protein RbpA [Actinokineospora sp.]|uniref:RNA polymerase-binding protein RbpA n=1 Tax=Actinokineospora sp. TaxID=1872133 RepID=UPI003D6A575A